MFISFLTPSVFEDVHARHLCVFYRQLGAFGRDQIAFIGEPAYFRHPADLRAEGRPEWQESWRNAYGYAPPKDLDGLRFGTLPPDLFRARLRRLKSSWKLYGQMLTRRLPELEAAFSTGLESLGQVGPREAVLTFANNPSVAHVAGRHRIPIVHNEFGPLRPPAYEMTGYWDRSGVSRGTEAARRFRVFSREVAAAHVPMRSSDELLHTLRRVPMPDVPAPQQAPYRVGVALQGEDNAHVHGTGALDLLSMARQRHHRDEILVRYHSGAVARYADSLGVTDDSPGATEFIVRCETVLTVSSGTALEALLLGRRAVVVGDSPFALAADRSLDVSPARRGARHLRALNFLVFGYLVPGALMFDPDYVRWRLTSPSELDIFRHHQRWYRDRLASTTQQMSSPVGVAAAATPLDAVPESSVPLPLVVFGAGAATPGLVAGLRPDRFALLEVFDNDRSKWGTSLAGLTITPPRFRPEASVAVASETHADAIVHQLRGLGYAPERILRLR